MKRYIAIFIAICLLIAGHAACFAQEHKYIPKKKHHKPNKIYRWIHRDRERRNKFDSGHTEFKNRKKKDRKRIAKHHLNPYKPSKPDKHMPDLRSYEKDDNGKAGGSKEDLKAQRAKDRDEQAADKPVTDNPAEKSPEKPADKPTEKPDDKPSGIPPTPADSTKHR